MFSSKGLFKNVPCPAGDTCRLPNCIFGHPDPLDSQPDPSKASVAAKHTIELKVVDDHDLGGDRKRRKLNGKPKPFVGALVEAEPPSNRLKHDASNGTTTISSLSRDITPPESTRAKVGANESINSFNHSLTKAPFVAQTTTQTQTAIKSPVPPRLAAAQKSQPPPTRIEELNPRLVSTNPAPHITRLKLLQKIHEQMARLNYEASPTDQLAAQQLVVLALDEEERIAKTHASLYRPTMGRKVLEYKAMPLQKWLLELEAKYASKSAAKSVLPAPAFSTELSLELERRLLSRYRISLKGLDKYGFVLEPPKEAAVAATQRAVEMSDFWEFCDRCGTRFQVFPDRRADGALTSSGTCHYHWSRPFRDKKTKESLYQCCNSPPGTPGCTTCPTHVFKSSDPTRMASSLQFERTPNNDTVDPSLAIAFDCEMGYTTVGMEMIRISAATWPDEKPLFDFLVRPIGHILDLNTRFSGVTPSQFLNAEEYNSTTLPPRNDKSLYILPPPRHARDLLFSLISPNTPLIGHSIDNDLNVLRMIHPTIVDTVVLYPHPNGLPLRFGLKRLAKEYLSKTIQNAGAAGHDSLEDATATGDLVRAKMAQEWKILKSEGWKIENGAFVVPEAWEEKGAGPQFMEPPPEWWKS